MTRWSVTGWLPSAPPELHLVIDRNRRAVFRRRLVDREADRHRSIGIVDGGVRLDIVLDAVDEMGNLGHERVVRDITRGWLDGWEGPVVERAGVVLLRVDAVVLNRSLRAEKTNVEDVRRVSVKHSR